MTRPDFFVAGFYKCGTTSLYFMLQQHRNILVSSEKENFFFADKELYKKGIGWYEKTYYNFDKKNNLDKVAEINPGLAVTFGTARRLRHFYDVNTPIVFIVRNPVDFLYSHFKFSIRRGAFSLKEMNFCKMNSYAVAFDKYVKKNRREMEQFKHFFSSQLREYQKYFNNIKVVFLEDMFQDGEKVYREILDFWGLAYEKVDFGIKANATDFIPRYPLVKKIHLGIRLYNQRLIVEEKSYAKQCLLHLTGRIEEQLFAYIEKTGIEDKSRIHEETRMNLEKFFQSEKERIENITNRDLNDLWW